MWENKTKSRKLEKLKIGKSHKSKKVVNPKNQEIKKHKINKKKQGEKVGNTKKSRKSD